MVKREGSPPAKRGRAGKKSRTVNLVPVVVDALCEAEALPSDLRTTFEAALPKILALNKADRHAYEAEVVDEAEKALGLVQAAIESSHAAALTKQNEVIAPVEHAKRTEAKKQAAAGVEATTAASLLVKESQSAASDARREAQVAVKAADKEAARAEKELEAAADEKKQLSEILENEFVALKEGTSQSEAGKLAVKKLASIGKEYKLDATLLKTLPLTCKKEPETRTEFETLMFSSLKVAIDRQIEGLTKKLVELEQSKGERLIAVTSAKECLEKADATLTAENTAASAAQAAVKAAEKELTKADEYLYQVWRDMKEACDKQDQLANELGGFKDKVCSAFQQLKEKEPEPEAPEEPEPAEDAAMEAAPAEAEAARDEEDAN